VFNTCNNIASAVVAHTASKPVSKRHLMRHTFEIGLDRWQSLNYDAWTLIVGRLKGRSARPKARSPQPHQRAAISAATTHFIGKKQRRGRLIMPCGTGKSLTAYWIAEALRAKTVLVAVPSLALIRQSVADWTREFLAHGIFPDWICVCSDETVGNLEHDEFVGEVYELGLPTHTAPIEIAALLRAPSKAPRIIFTTYQSSDKLATAARRARVRFDLAILDEAHKTVGIRSKQFATLLRENKIIVRHRLFMTATERVLRGRSDDVLSMDNEKDYGKCFFQLSYKEAIRRHIISDYKILTMTVSDDRIRRLIAENRILNLNLRNLDETEAQSVAAGIALKRVFKEQKIKHAISFHRSIRGADHYREQQDALNRVRDIGPKTVNLHISSKKTAGERGALLREFVKHSRSLMTNARCLTEGVDVPAIDCVLFADPKQSRIDIVQAAGRALRRHPRKRYGYILLPLIVPQKIKFQDFAETTAFRQVARTITALSIQDERIADEFRTIEKGRISSGKIVEIDGDVPVGMKITLGDFAKAISTRVWDSVGRVNWRSFEDARAYVRSLRLSNGAEWLQCIKNKQLPPDIPASPEYIYKDSGWLSMGDWLGTGFVAHSKRQFRRFKDARAFVRNLALKSTSEWIKYGRSGKKPDDIPFNPWRSYAGIGWASWGDWLGGSYIAPSQRYRSFNDARAFVRKLRLNSYPEWLDYLKSGKKPNDIPAAPSQVYAEAGWSGWGDWLGTGRRRVVDLRPFKEAREFALRLGLKSYSEWREYLKSREISPDIPHAPNQTYLGAGWAGWADWLGVGPRYRTFKEARAYVRDLSLKSASEWRTYCKSGNKPFDIPTHPHIIYARVGWASWGDWLGTGRVADNLRRFRAFKKARAFVRKLGLKSETEWREYLSSGKKPHDIPAHPRSAYAKAGWSGMADWLGAGRRRVAGPRSFAEARKFVRGLGLTSRIEWREYLKSGQCPHDIPTAPHGLYKEVGWEGWADWLGYA
jgi:superfamily II DNA or RNA helicase